MGNSDSSLNKTFKDDCIFCKIWKANDESKILKQDEKFVLFSDIHPASTQHYLVVPKEHFHSPMTLHTQEHIDLINEMISFGREYLTEQGGCLEDCKMGFHWPPFTSVDHLHLHVIYPASAMGLMFRTIYHSTFFVTPEYAIDHIKSKLPVKDDVQ